ncbi:hypothetical protein [Pseudomonas sp. NPDC007930]|uniref:hypothetical protein n=1 Tax=Pseudomonas sp. NPDC007930 TaxID=3364417 RepID=UPI0036ECF4D2
MRPYYFISLLLLSGCGATFVATPAAEPGMADAPAVHVHPGNGTPQRERGAAELCQKVSC